MADNEKESDNFEKLLQQFINADFDDDEASNPKTKSKADKKTDKKNNNELEAKFTQNATKDSLQLSAQGKTENDEASELLEKDLADVFNEARDDIKKQEEMPQLSMEESELAQALINFGNSVDNVLKSLNKGNFEFGFDISEMYPNYKPRRGKIISSELARGWALLSNLYPDSVGKFDIHSTDEEFLNFAEKINNQDLQLAIISYVEIIIDTESCEISYKMKLAKYQEQHIKKIMYEEYLARKERQQRFIDALKKRDFPVDAERLITNYFRTAQKDVDGAFKALTTNPAIFAPIDFNKIKPRFFGLVKVSPKDGIRLNIEIGKFLKKLKV